MSCLCRQHFKASSEEHGYANMFLSEKAIPECTISPLVKNKYKMMRKIKNSFLGVNFSHA